MPNDVEYRSRVERVWSIGSTFGLVVLTPLGFRNGYVRVPEDHPWYGRDYDLIDDQVEVHGGLTFAGELSPDTYAARGGSLDGIPDGWYVGFDCAHAWDAPEPEVYRRALGPAYDRLESSLGRAPWGTGHVWTTVEVAAEVERLAAQVLAAYTPR